MNQSEIQKHLGMFLDVRLNYKEHIQNILNKVIKTIWLLRKLQKVLLVPLLIKISKSHTWPRLDYRDISTIKYIPFLSSETGIYSAQCRNNSRSCKRDIEKEMLSEISFQSS